MDWLKIKSKAVTCLERYRYAVLVLAIGLGLMLIPTGEKEETQQPVTVAQTQEESFEDRLSALLSQIHGAGKVQVLLTVASGEEVIYQSDGDISSNDSSYSERSDTVIITGQDRDQQGLIRQVNPPEYLGAVILCQGADSSSVRLALVDAVSKATGLGADKIAVLKMK